MTKTWKTVLGVQILSETLNALFSTPSHHKCSYDPFIAVFRVISMREGGGGGREGGGDRVWEAGCSNAGHLQGSPVRNGKVHCDHFRVASRIICRENTENKAAEV